MARVVAVGVPHHITQRGNNRQDVFLVDENRRFYLQTLAENCRRYGVGLLGYSLMSKSIWWPCPSEAIRWRVAWNVRICSMPSALTLATAAADICGRTAFIPVH